MTKERPDLDAAETWCRVPVPSDPQTEIVSFTLMLGALKAGWPSKVRQP